MMDTMAVANPLPPVVVFAIGFLKAACGSSTRVWPPRTTKPVMMILYKKAIDLKAHIIFERNMRTRPIE